MKSLYLLSGFCIVLIMPNFSENYSSSPDDTYELFRRAYSNLNVDLMDSIYSENAYYLSPGAPIEIGKSKFLPGFREMFKMAENSGESLDIEFDIQSRKFIDDQVIDIGYYKLTRSVSDKSRSFVGKFITVLEKSEGNFWKFIVDGYSDAPLSSWTKN